MSIMLANKKQSIVENKSTNNIREFYLHSKSLRDYVFSLNIPLQKTLAQLEVYLD